MIDDAKVAAAGKFFINHVTGNLNRGEILFLLSQLLMTCFEEADFSKQQVGDLLVKLLEDYEPIRC